MLFNRADTLRFAVTRRAVLQAGLLAFASRFTRLASPFFDWLTRMFSTGADLRFDGVTG